MMDHMYRSGNKKSQTRGAERDFMELSQAALVQGQYDPLVLFNLRVADQNL